MRLYTSDGHRLATDIVQLENSVDDLKGILPFKLAEMLLQAQPSGTLGFFFDESHFYCSTGGTVYGSKFVATEFTDVSEILNTELFQSIKIAKCELLDSVKRIKGFVQSAKIAKLNERDKSAQLRLRTALSKPLIAKGDIGELDIKFTDYITQYTDSFVSAAASYN